MELPFAGLHQLCAPMLERLDSLPAPQRDALATVFGMAAGSPADHFRVGLAVLNVLSDVAAEQPLLCLIDDYQWLDHASARILAFVARRLGAESLGLIFAAPVPAEELAGLPDLVIRGLREDDAAALLDSVLTTSLDRRVRDQIVAETRGNPLALLELTRGRTAAELAGGFAVPGGAPGPGFSGSLERDFRRRNAALPPQTRTLLLVAAADPTGDPALVWRAAKRLDLDTAAVAQSVPEGLVEFGGRVKFRHPLARSVSYWSVSPQQRQQAHRALAEETDPVIDPDRRSWHLAQATPGPDEEVAAELERSAGRARARGGLAAAAAFLERVATMTLEPSRRARRALAAATTGFQAGAFDVALDLLATAETGRLSEHDRARCDILRAQLASVSSRGGDAPLLFLKAARRLDAIDPGLARQTCLDALSAATFAGRCASPGGGVLDVARVAATLPMPPEAPQASDFLLAGMAANVNDGYVAAVPSLRQALAASGGDTSADQQLRWLWLMNLAALQLWDDEQWVLLSRRYLRLARMSGALSELPLALNTRAMMLLFSGDLSGAGVLVEEQAAVAEATRSQLAPDSAMCLAAMRGRRAEASALIEATIPDAPSHGEGISIAVAEWTKALLHNGFGNYPEAMAAAQHALHHQGYPDRHYPGVANLAAVELVESAARSGAADVAAEATAWIAAMTGASGTSWARGVEARSHAMLAEGACAEESFRESICCLEQSQVRTELARAHLVYGEWLRRERRRTDAREQLRAAYEMLEAMGMAAFADRARRELLATGETARKRTVSHTTELTAQEGLIARLARDGMSNPQIASRLFLSARTVQYHLRKVFAKLDISSRSQLDRVLPERG